MADRVFDNVTNWSTYQDKQLAVLSSLEKSFNVSLNMSRVIKDNLSSMQSAMSSMIQSANSLAKYVNNLPNSSRSGGRNSSNARAAREAADQMRRNLEEVHRIEMQNQQDIYEQTMDNLEEQLRVVREELENTRERQRTQQEMENSQRELIGYIKDESIKLIAKLGQMADNYLAASNNLIKISGQSGAAVQDTRNTIVNEIVGELNRQTGNLYSPQESYQKMVSIASEAAGGNLKALEEIARPLLIAEESMDVNLGDLAKTLTRLYNRYNFSSEEMEGLVNDIRGNTAGNSATAQATAEALAKMENSFALYAGGDTEKIAQFSSELSKVVSHLQSQGVDPNIYTDMMQKIISGDARKDLELIQILSAAGSSADEAQSLARSGKSTELNAILMRGIENIIDQYGGIDNVFFGGETWSEFSKLSTGLVDVYAALKSPNWKDIDEFVASTDDTTPAVEIISDKFVSWSDQASHWLESIANGVANIQNYLGISVTDILAGVGIYQGVKKGYKLFQGAKGAGPLGKIGSKAGGAGGTSGLVSGLANAGTAMGSGATTSAGAAAAGAAGIAGMVVGGATVISGGYDIVSAQEEVDWQKRADKETQGGIKIGGVAAGAGLGAVIGSVVPVVGTAIGAAVGAGLGGVATLIWGDEWAKSLTDAIDGTARIKKSMEEMAKANTSVSKAISDISTYEELEKAYREQKRELDKLTPGTEDYEDMLHVLEGTVEKLRSTFPDYIKLEEDGVTIKEESMKATESMLEAEKALAKIRASSAVYNAIDTEDELEDQLGKSKKEADSWKSKEDTITKFQEVFEDVEKYAGTTRESMAEFFMKGESGELTGGAKRAYENFQAMSPTIHSELGIGDTGGAAFVYEDIVFGDGGDKIEKVLTGAATAREKATKDQQAYDKMYIDAVALLETTLGMPFMSAAEAYQSMSPTDRSYFEKQLNLLSSLNSTYDMLSEGVALDVATIGKTAGLPGYASGTNYIDRDQIAVLHEGEAVVPKRYNPAANMNELEALREQARKRQEDEGKESDESSEYIRQSFEVLQEIKEFLSTWKNDNAKSAAINNAKNKYNPSVRYISGYLR